MRRAGRSGLKPPKSERASAIRASVRPPNRSGQVFWWRARWQARCDGGATESATSRWVTRFYFAIIILFTFTPRKTSTYPPRGRLRRPQPSTPPHELPGVCVMPMVHMHDHAPSMSPGRQWVSRGDPVHLALRFYGPVAVRLSHGCGGNVHCSASHGPF